MTDWSVRPVDAPRVIVGAGEQPALVLAVGSRAELTA